MHAQVLDDKQTLLYIVLHVYNHYYSHYYSVNFDGRLQKIIFLST
jgi:hypothetical protein